MLHVVMMYMARNVPSVQTSIDKETLTTVSCEASRSDVKVSRGGLTTVVCRKQGSLYAEEQKITALGHL